MSYIPASVCPSRLIDTVRAAVPSLLQPRPHPSAGKTHRRGRRWPDPGGDAAPAAIHRYQLCGLGPSSAASGRCTPSLASVACSTVVWDHQRGVTGPPLVYLQVPCGLEGVQREHRTLPMAQDERDSTQLPSIDAAAMDCTPRRSWQVQWW